MYCFQSKKRMVFYYVDGGLKILDFNSTAKKKKNVPIRAGMGHNF